MECGDRTAVFFPSRRSRAATCSTEYATPARKRKQKRSTPSLRVLAALRERGVELDGCRASDAAISRAHLALCRGLSGRAEAATASETPLAAGRCDRRLVRKRRLPRSCQQRTQQRCLVPSLLVAESPGKRRPTLVRSLGPARRARPESRPRAALGGWKARRRFRSGSLGRASATSSTACRSPRRCSRWWSPRRRTASAAGPR